jgi:hypothetical protein
LQRQESVVKVVKKTLTHARVPASIRALGSVHRLIDVLAECVLGDRRDGNSHDGQFALYSARRLDVFELSV